jgi:hypothetical protein
LFLIIFGWRKWLGWLSYEFNGDFGRSLTGLAGWYLYRVAWCTFRNTAPLKSAGLKDARKETSVSAFAREKLGFEPDEKQRAVLDSVAKRGILNCTRQWGKSTVTAAKAVHRAWSEPGSLVLVASPSERQSAEFLRKAAGFVRRLGIPVRGQPISLVLPNASRIVGLPATEGTVRGFSAVSLLLIDEASRVPDALYKSLRPVMAVAKGDMWLMSTPYGKRGFFYEEWAHGGKRWERVLALATECARIPAEFLDEERASLGGEWFAQEYMGEFVDNGAGWFERGVVERALSDDEPLRL